MIVMMMLLKHVLCLLLVIAATCAQSIEVPCPTTAVNNTHLHDLLSANPDGSDCNLLACAPHVPETENTCACSMSIQIQESNAKFEYTKHSTKLKIRQHSTLATIRNLYEHSKDNRDYWFCSQVWGETFASQCGDADAANTQSYTPYTQVFCVCYPGTGSVAGNCKYTDKGGDFGWNAWAPPLVKSTLTINIDDDGRHYLHNCQQYNENKDCSTLQDPEITEVYTWYCHRCETGSQWSLSNETRPDNLLARRCCTDVNCDTTKHCSQMFNVRTCAALTDTDNMVRLGCLEDFAPNVTDFMQSTSVTNKKKQCKDVPEGHLCICEHKNRLDELLRYPKCSLTLTNLTKERKTEWEDVKVQSQSQGLLQCGHDGGLAWYCFALIDFGDSQIEVKPISTRQAKKEYKVTVDDLNVVFSSNKSAQEKWSCKPLNETLTKFICVCKHKTGEIDLACHKSKLARHISEWTKTDQDPFPLSINISHINPDKQICARFTGLICILHDTTTSAVTTTMITSVQTSSVHNTSSTGTTHNQPTKANNQSQESTTTDAPVSDSTKPKSPAATVSFSSTAEPPAAAENKTEPASSRTGTIVAVVIVCLVCLVVAAVLILLLLKKRRDKQRQDEQAAADQNAVDSTMNKVKEEGALAKSEPPPVEQEKSLTARDAEEQDEPEPSTVSKFSAGI